MVKNLPAVQETWVQLLVRAIPWRREWLPTLVFLPGESHGQRSLVGYSPWGHKELDTNGRPTLLLFFCLFQEFNILSWTGVYCRLKVRSVAVWIVPEGSP